MYGTFLTLLCVLLTLQTTATHERRLVGSARRYCGDKLTNSLSLLCNGYYKRDPVIPYYLEKYEPPADGDVESSLFRQRRDMLSMTRDRQFRRKLRGVASECCHKPCTLTELTTYCGKLEDVTAD